MCINKFVFILQIFVLVSSESKYGPRKARLFSFNSVNEDIKIDLDFSIPFISIPVKQTMDTAFGFSSSGLPTININPASLALGSAVVLGTTVLVPWFIKSYVTYHPQKKYLRLLDVAEFETDEMLELMSKMLTDSQNMRGCGLKLACRIGQTPASGNLQEMWNYVSNNRLLSSMVNATAVEDAMLSGRHGRNCDYYKPCLLTDRHIPMILDNFSSLIGKL